MTALPIPVKALEQHTIVLGKTGSGKSSALRLMVEDLLDRDERVVIVTAKSDWWGLKTSASGKRAGYPIVIFGGERADLPLHPLSGKAMAELLATGNRSAVLQMRDMMPGERTQFWIDFASHLFRLLKGKLYLVIDEVHNFAPKGKILSPQAGLMLHWSNKIAAEARGLGINLIAASQRPQKVHNDFLTSCETLVAMRVIHKSDRDAIEDWIEGCGDEKSGEQVLKTLAQMKRGDAWAWSPEIEFGPKQVHFPMFKTYDSFKPQANTTDVKLKGWADVNLTDVREKLDSFVKEAEANDPRILRATIKRLEIELKNQAPVAPKVKAPKSMKVSKEEIREEIKKQFQRFIGYQKSMESVRGKLEQFLKDWPPIVDKNIIELSAISQLQAKPPVPVTPNLQKQKQYVPSHPLELPETWGSMGKFKLGTGPRRMLAVLVQWSPNGMPEGQWRSHAGFRKSGTWSTYKSILLSAGFVECVGDKFHARPAGIEYMGGKGEAAPTTTKEVLDIWRPKLGIGPMKILDTVLYHRSLPMDELAAQSGYAISGTFSTYLSQLKTARLIERHGKVIKPNAETLFL